MLRRQNKEHSEHTRDLDAQIKAINKAAKSQDKEIYNLGKSLQNSQDTVSKLNPSLGGVSANFGGGFRPPFSSRPLGPEGPKK